MTQEPPKPPENNMDEYDPLLIVGENDPNLIRHEEKRSGWMDKFGMAFGQMVLAIIIFLIAFAILFSNEERTVIETWRLNEGGRLVVPLSSDVPDSDNNGQLVHLTAKVTTREVLSDELFFMSAKAIKLRRIMEMFQWREVEDAEGSISYEKAWSQHKINSLKFKKVQGHNNPDVEFNNNEYVSHDVMIGRFNLSESHVLKLENFERYTLTQSDYMRINPEMGDYVLHENTFFKGDNPKAPEVGDLRVWYEVVKPGQEVSVIGLQNVDSIQPYNTDYNVIRVVDFGQVDADTMFRKEVKARDVSVIWWLRFAGWIGMLVSVWMMLNSFEVLHHIFPFIHRLVGYSNFELAFFASLSFVLLTIAFSWIHYQPAFGLGLIVLSTSLIVSTALLSKMQDKMDRRRFKKMRAQAEKGAAIPSKVKFMKAKQD